MIEVANRDGIAVVTLAHGKANALDIALCDAIAEQFRTLTASPARAIVLTAQGRIFCAGVDLLQLLDGGARYVAKFIPSLNAAFETVFCCPKPVVAALNGHAIAGGCVLASCADRQLMVNDGARIGVTELLVGVPFPPLAFEAMRLAAEPRYLNEVILTGTTYLAEPARERGLIDEVVEPVALMERAMAAASALAALPAEAFALTKRQLHQPAMERIARDGAAIDAAIDKLWQSPATAERIRDYVTRTFKKT